MDRRTKDTLRGGVAAFGVATGLLALASTAQTPDGYIHASFGGPLNVFNSSTADVLSIGDGANDAGELAALLKGPVGPAAKIGVPDSPYRVAYEAGAAPNATTGAPTALPSLDPIGPMPDGNEPPLLPAKPVVDAQGRIDCTGAVSCKTDPATNVTTVTYPDGVIAVVQKINDLTVVAYKTITEALPSEIATLLPPAPEAPPVLAAVAPTAASTPSLVPPAPSTAPTPVPSPVLQTTAPTTSAPPRETKDDPAPPIDLTAPIDLNPPKDTGQSGTGSVAPSPTGAPRPNLPNLPDKVKDAFGGIADTVKGAVDSVGKALNPGASTKPQNPGKSGESGDSSQSGDNGKTGSRTNQNDSEG